jgi:calnexin
MKSNILFDNIYVGHSIDDAAALAKESWVVKSEHEKLNEPKETKAPGSPDLSSNKYIAQAQLALAAVQAYMNTLFGESVDFIDIAKQDPLSAVKELPHVALILASSILLPLFMIGLLFSGSKAPKAEKKEKVEKKKVEKVVEEKEEEVVAEVKPKKRAAKKAE